MPDHMVMFFAPSILAQIFLTCAHIYHFILAQVFSTCAAMNN